MRIQVCTIEKREAAHRPFGSTKLVPDWSSYPMHTMRWNLADNAPQLRPVREHEILRTLVQLPIENTSAAAQAACKMALNWAASRTGGQLPAAAWELQSFDHILGGRSCSAIRFVTDAQDTWALRADDPDKNVADRVWTTEIMVEQHGADNSLSIRLLASSRELRPDANPATPSLLREILNRMPVKIGSVSLRIKPTVISSENDAERLLAHLLDPHRLLPVCVMSTSSWSGNEDEPLLNADEIARSLLGLCTVVVLPAKFTWVLSRSLGKMLAVYEGAIRIYWPNFTEDADPFSHDLILANSLSSDDTRANATTRLKWNLAAYSVRVSPETRKIRPFAALRSLQTAQKQNALMTEGASDRVQLEAANELIAALRQERKEAEEQIQWLSDEHDEAETRAKDAEEQSSRDGFRLQQLLAQLNAAGEIPDSKIELPATWAVFEDWCDTNLAGRVLLAPQARRELNDPKFYSPKIAAQCMLWLANDYRNRRIEGGEGSLRDVQVVEGIRNAPCGNDAYSIHWRGQTRDVEWHIKTNSNTRDPNRCLRIYYFWDDQTVQSVITFLPAHRDTSAS